MEYIELAADHVRSYVYPSAAATDDVDDDGDNDAVASLSLSAAWEAKPVH